MQQAAVPKPLANIRVNGMPLESYLALARRIEVLQHIAEVVRETRKQVYRKP